MKKVDIESVRNILIINLGGIGDVLLSIPALRALRQEYPRGYIALLTVPRSKTVIDNLKLIDRIIPFELSFSGLLELKRNLGEKRFDLAINMRTITSFISALKMAVLFSLIGARYRAGRDTGGRGFFLNIKIPEKDLATMHDVDYNLKIVKRLGADTDDKSINLDIKEEDARFIKDYLSRNDVAESDLLVGINPGTTWPSRRWPIENFAKVIDILNKRGYKIVVTGSKGEIHIANKLKELTDAKILIAAGKTSVGQLIALINRFNLFITNDNGPMHLASVLSTPLVAIFGPGEPGRFRPYYNPDKSKILYKKVKCSPCFKRDCKSLMCLRAVSPGEVIEASFKLLCL